jgi:amino acid transporter
MSASAYTIKQMRCLGEMTTWIPLPGATPRFCSRFADEALGFAVGWNQWYNCAITVCAEISAAAAVIQFWNDTISVSPNILHHLLGLLSHMMKHQKANSI